MIPSDEQRLQDRVPVMAGGKKLTAGEYIGELLTWLAKEGPAAGRLLPSHKGVGILRPDGDTAAGADVLAMTVRTYYMPNNDWHIRYQRGRALREAAGLLTGHATGTNPATLADHAAVTKTIGAGHTAAQPGVVDRSAGLPEPLASVVAYLGDDLDKREFIPTAELIDALGVEPTSFGRQMGELGCRPRQGRVDDDGLTRQVRGYPTADLRNAADQHRTGS